MIRNLLLGLACFGFGCGDKKAPAPKPTATQPADVKVDDHLSLPASPCEQTCAASCVHAGDNERPFADAPELQEKARAVDIKMCEANCFVKRCMRQK